MGECPLVSVIITTKNEEKNIERCIKSILNQTYPKECIEIIVVDNASTDKTKEIAKKYTDKVFDKGPERSSQRNFGAQQSNGKYILYLDADMELSPKVIEEAVEKMEKDDSVVGLYIPEVIMGKKWFSRIRRFEREFYNATVIDAVRFIRKDVFLSVGGFDESLPPGPEDWDLDKRLKKLGKLDIITSPLFHHEEELSLIKFLSKKAYYTPGIEQYIKKWGKDDPDVKKQVGIWYRYFWVFVENEKWKKILLHPIKFLGVLFYKFLQGVVYLLAKFFPNFKGEWKR